MNRTLSVGEIYQLFRLFRKLELLEELNPNETFEDVQAFLDKLIQRQKEARRRGKPGARKRPMTQVAP